MVTTRRTPALVQDRRRECDLPPALRAELGPVIVRGDEMQLAGHHRAAIGAYGQALEMIPTGRCPRTRAALLTALGDAAVRAGAHGLAVRCLQDAVRLCGELRNPLVYLRLGQARFERGDLELAADDLMRAHAVGGADAFEGEDPKYLEHVAALVGP